MTESPILEIFWDLSFGTNFREIPKIFYGFFSKKFLKISPRNSWEFLRTCHQLYGLFGELNKKHWLKKFLRVSQEFFFGNSWDFLRNIYEKISGLDHQLSDFVRNWKKTLSFKKFNNFPKDLTVKEFNEFSRICYLDFESRKKASSPECYRRPRPTGGPYSCATLPEFPAFSMETPNKIVKILKI